MSLENLLEQLSLDESLPDFANQSSPHESSYRIPQSEPQRWKAHLAQEGFVVLANVLSEEEVKTSLNKLWDWLESLGSGIDRMDDSTWTTSNWPGELNLGFMSSHGGSHSEAAWAVRGHPNIKRAFSEIWGTDELLVSFDTFICWRPWFGHPERTPCVERLHVDQSPRFKPGFHCVQGMCTLVSVDPDVGGLQVIPRTHTPAVQQDLRDRYGGSSDWLQLRPDDSKYIGNGHLLLAQAGDLILWDSRLIHGGKVGEIGIPSSLQEKELGSSAKVDLDEQNAPKGEDNVIPQLARAALTVCMTPKEKANKQVLRLREQAFENGSPLTHWPHFFHRQMAHDSGGRNIQAQKYRPPTLSDEQKKLIC